MSFLPAVMRILERAIHKQLYEHLMTNKLLSPSQSGFYGGPQLSHQNQMFTANYKALTSNSNRSHQIQIAHSKFKLLTANYKALTSNSNRSQQIQITHSKLQIAHSKFKSPTANSNRSQQIKVAHSKFKLLTSNYKLLTPLCVFGYLQPAVQLV